MRPTAKPTPTKAGFRPFAFNEPVQSAEFSIVPAVVAIAIGAWIVGTGFMGVYNMAIETVFLCYTIDLARAGACTQESLKKLCDEAEAEEIRAAREGGGRFFARKPVIELSVVAETELKGEHEMSSTRPAATMARKVSFSRGTKGQAEAQGGGEQEPGTD